MKFLLLTLLLIVSACATRQQPRMVQETSGNVTNVRVAGSLAKTHELPCISISEANNSYTPADLYASAAKCDAAGRRTDAVQIYFLAGAYSVYDSMRVKDRSAIQARQVLIINNFGSISDTSHPRLYADIQKITSRQPAAIAALCAGIKAVGKPSYHPHYMILHGMAAFDGIEGDGLVPDYDAAANWAKTLAPLRCP